MKTGLFLEKNKFIPFILTYSLNSISFFQMNWLLLFFLFSCFSNLRAQDSLRFDTTQNSYEFLFQLDIEAEYFTTDKLQNIYFISSKNEIIKLQPDGKEEFRFINKTLGQPTYIDATNPFNLLLFYPDYQNVVTLDRTLNLAGQVNLFEIGLFGLEAVGMAGDGNLWLFDIVNFRLKKIGQTGKTILQSADLSLELRKSIKPNFILERDQLVYVNDPVIGIMVFDVFGKYLKTLPLKNLSTFQIMENELLFYENEKLNSFHLQTLLQNSLLLPEGISTNDQLRIEKDRLYILQKEQLKVFRF